LQNMKFLKIIFFLLFCINANAQTKITNPSKPKLIIGLVIDQMRYDYLFKYANNYTQGGFKRLMREGFNCESTNLNYIPSVTGCGHASIYTGSVPAINGIASNDWYNRATNKMQYCVQDDNEQTVGVAGKSGKMSPRNMYTTTITDELKLATNMRSKVVGISVKDRGSILPAGHSANAAYWMDDSLGYFISSTYYMKELPTWVANFNEKEIARNYLKNNWDLFLNKNKYYQSTADSNAYEGKYKTEKTNTLPHNTAIFPKASDVKRTPFGNNISLDFSKECIKNYGMGKGAETDFIAISLSSTDYVGHQYGTNALETEDTYYRLDQSIEDFLKFLDTEIGAGNYTLFLTADHGAAHNPKYLQDQNIPAGFIYENEMKKKFAENSIAKFGHNVIGSIGDNQIWINDSADKKEATEFVIAELKKINEVQFVINSKELGISNLPEKIKNMAINGFNNNRSGDVFFLLKPAFIDGYNGQITGTTHGTWNPYDSHIPLLWYGYGIKKGNSFKEVSVTDIAATLAALMHIQAPNGCIGTVITEALK
jgi:predicted AlkP superfamily pyrophosphatase or phosphodiesterase